MRSEAYVIGQGRIRRRRDKAELLFRHRLPVTIDEVGHAEAPVSVIVRRTVPDVYRHHGGSHWARLSGIEVHEPVTPGTFADLVSGRGASEWTRNPFTRQGRRTGTVPTPLDVTWTVEDDGLGDAERLADVAARDILFIEGVLHRRVAEPAWRVSYTVREAPSPLDGTILPRWHAGLALDHEGREPDFWSAARFRIDAVAEADRFLSSLPERDQDRSVPAVETFDVPLSAPLVQACAPVAMAAMPGLASMPDDVLEAYDLAASKMLPEIGDLRELLARLDRVRRGGGPGAYVARCLVSDIAFPVVLADLFPESLAYRA